MPEKRVSPLRFVRSAAVLCLLVPAGCAGVQRAVLPPVADDPCQAPAECRVLRVGDYVRIETRSRDVALGDVKDVGPDHVVLGRVGNFGYEERSFRAEDILTIELNGGDTAGSAALGVGAILGVAVLAFAIAFALWGNVGTS